jgi:hypothetical protein
VGDNKARARSGWGVIFEIGPGGCQDASLYGLDPYPLPTDPKSKYISGPVVYEYTTEMINRGNSGGEASVILINDGCATEIEVITRIPGDAEAIPLGEGSQGRFPNELIGPTIYISTLP